MKRRTTIVFGLLATAIASPFIFESCRSETPGNHLQVISHAFFASLKANESSFLNAEIVVSPTRIAVQPSDDEAWIYFDRPASVPPPNPGGGSDNGGNTGGDPTMPYPKTITDLFDMAEQFGIDLSLTQNGEYNDSILISETEAREALQPMLQSSRIYFESRGLSQDEISQAIAESGEDETMLIPLSMELAANDLSSPPIPDLTASLTNMFTIQLYATPQWEKAGLCALEALGIDIFTRI